ncbi:MAG: signal recognition particle protein [Candidatus Bipolaricaulota bacterium]|nr:MAG: signal recognition particle protein [Candidatus Bipolaricaulota bacterium]
MFDSLSGRLGDVFRRLRGAGTIGEKELAESLREIRLALLEADVNYKVVRDLVERIRARAQSAEILGGLNPGQNVVRVVRDELTALMGGSRAALDLHGRPAAILFIGLQGSGKTTSVAKLAVQLTSGGRRPVLTTTDVHRPAAAEQLQVLGEAIGVPVFHDGSLTPGDVPPAAKAWAKSHARDVVLVDTAGRQQIDETMMAELEAIAVAAAPDESLLVVDAMSGQDAVNVASSFVERIGVTGVILTKLDGDARGGAALSVLAVTGTPIKFVGVGEKTDQLEPFHPERMASRILGMGDVLTLIEQAEGAIDEERAKRVAEHIATQRLTLQDFLEQMEEMSKLGPLSQVLERLPLGRKRPVASEVDERDVGHALAILRAMTVEERLNPSIIGGSRKKRIARGSGTRVRDVNRLLSQFDDARRAFRQLGGRHRKGTLPFDLPGV